MEKKLKNLLEVVAPWFFKKILAAHLFLLVGVFAHSEIAAQSRVNGKILDNLGNPLPYANVLLLSPMDSLMVKGAVSEEDGSFYFDELDNADYMLSVAMIGYRKYWDHLTVKANTPIDLQAITLMETEDELDEITVTAKKPLYEKQIDRLVVNVQETITAAGGTVLEVLSRSPGVMVNQHNYTVTLNGKSGVMVMINDNLIRLPIDAALQMLDGLSAANVEKIELISNPPAKYDAEGTGGIIHIVMAEHPDFGSNGNFGLAAGSNQGKILGANLDFNRRTQKSSFFASYSILQDQNRQKLINSMDVYQPGFVSSFHSFSDRPFQLTVQNLRAGMGYTLGEKSEIGALVTLYERLFDTHSTVEGRNTFTADSSMKLNISSIRFDRWRSLTSNIHFIHRPNPNSQLRMDFDWLWYDNMNPADYFNDFHFLGLGFSSSSTIEVNKSTPIGMKISKIDYSIVQSERLELETGLKYTASQFNNNVEVFETENGSRKMVPHLSMEATMRENISAGYATANWEMNEKTQINAGIRYEHTVTDIESELDNEKIYRNYGNFFPSLFVKRKLGEEKEVYFGYSKRITRPTYNDLAPFVLIVDPNTYFSGNPALWPAISEGVKVDFTLRRAIITLDYSQIKNHIANFQPEFDPINNLQVIRSQNMDHMRISSLILSVPWIITDWWDIQSNTTIMHQKIWVAPGENTQGLYVLNLDMASNFNLNRGYAVEVSGNYQSTQLMGMWKRRPFGSLNVGIQKKLDGEKGTFRLNATDILSTNHVIIGSSMGDPRVDLDLILRLNIRAIRLTYTRNFGNRKLKAVNIKSGSEEDRTRVGVK
ncbi:outer membrane beta-barrel family protein [Pleomorphovibrio marinus]|uniref:outer membrane beta-barrel family protein n=1 Tax=Pleomorphovibrio marinus TaxID=2164132 RepID=UPI000E0A5264|nr:outer membrane beta-barrel family protein [Pleomorphovibrio marinus]